MYKHLSPEERMERIARILLRAIALDEVSTARDENDLAPPSSHSPPGSAPRVGRSGNDSRRS